MAQDNWWRDRQYDLYKERSKSTPRVATLTLVFAFVVLFKVIGPYRSLTDASVAQQSRLAQLRDEADALVVKNERIPALQTAVRSATQRIQESHWDEEANDLRSAFRRIQGAAADVIQADPGELQRAATFREQSSGAVQEGALSANRSANLARQQAPWDDQAFGERETRNAIRQNVQDNAPLGVLGESAEVGEIANALEVLELGSDEVQSREFQADRGAFLGRWTSEQSAKEADALVLRVTDHVQDSMISELDRLQALPDAKELLPDLAGEVDRLETQVSQWKEEHYGNRHWYSTVEGKHAEVGKIGGTISSFQGRVDSVLEASNRDLESAQAELDTQIQTLERDIAANEEERATLIEKLDSVLPSVVRGLVSPQDAIQLYPLALVALLVFNVLGSWNLRQNYLLLRRNIAELGPGAVQDLCTNWTLARKTGGGTALTLGLHLGAIGLLWWMFEAGREELAAWLASGGHDGVVPVLGDVGMITWLGRFVFAGSAVGIVAAMLGSQIRAREQVAGMPTSTTTPKASAGTRA